MHGYCVVHSVADEKFYCTDEISGLAPAFPKIPDIKP